MAPGPAPSAAPDIVVSVVRADVLEPEFGSVRPETAPGAETLRRVVRMRCTVELTCRAGLGQARQQQIAAMDAVLYELSAPEVRDASALRAPGDPGFKLERFSVTSLTTVADDAGPPAVRGEAVGWFWPPGVAGETGEPIRSALVRSVILPLALEPWPVDLRAGDPALALSVRVGTGGTAGFSAHDPPAVSPFGRLALRLVDAGGRPGLGALTGGDSGPAGSRIVAVDEDRAVFSYQPPAEEAHDQLVVAVARTDGAAPHEIGLELARFPLDVRP